MSVKPDKRVNEDSLKEQMLKMVRTITLRGMVSSQSGKLITLVALPTQSTTTVASICTHGQQNIRQMLSAFSNVTCLRKLVHGEERRRSYLSDSDTY